MAKVPSHWDGGGQDWELFDEGNCAKVWMFFLLYFPYSCFVLVNTFHNRKGVISFALDIVHLSGDGPGLVLVSPASFLLILQLSRFYQTSLVILPLFLPRRFCYLHKLPCWSKYTANLHLPVCSCISLLGLAVLQSVYCWFCYRYCYHIKKVLCTVAYFNVLTDEFKASKY